MKYLIVLIVAMHCMALSAFSLDKEALSQLNVEALVVKDLTTQEILYAKEALKKVEPASLTKIMTAMLAIEEGNLERPVIITEEMVAVEPTKAGYKVGEILILEDLIRAAMIKSDNDAAMAIAIAVGGSVKNFVAMMNEKAHQIGMENTSFTNPCGFDIGAHYSTPSDLLKLAEYAIQNDRFNEMTKQRAFTYGALNTPRTFVAKTHNRLLNSYQHAIGVKTGYTSKAGPCLIARAQKEGNDSLIVMLNSKVNRWAVAQEIFEEIFFMRQNRPFLEALNLQKIPFPPNIAN
jgi:serine-type D-Ala-D-Ala carboxypeptidase (penicillin-binding protein 5/6)